jgi:hypothetical protein
MRLSWHFRGSASGQAGVDADPPPTARRQICGIELGYAWKAYAETQRARFDDTRATAAGNSKGPTRAPRVARSVARWTLTQMGAGDQAWWKTERALA